MRKHHSVVGGVVLALALTACSDPDTEPNSQETPTAEPSASATRASPTPKTPLEKAANQLTSYLDARDDFYRAGKIDFKRLNKVAADDEYLQVQAAVIDLDQYDIEVNGQYVHTLSEPRPRSDSMIIITDCEDRTGVTERNKDGKRIEHTDPNGDPLRNPVPVEYTLVLNKGAWKVADSDIKWDQRC